MYYVSVNNEEVEITSYEPETDFFTIEELPMKPNADGISSKPILKADFINKKVWYEIEYIPQESQLDRIEKLVGKSKQEIIDEYTLELINNNQII